MGDFLIQERFVWFDARVRREAYPNASALAEHFEISRKTAQRTIEFLRDRLLAPLVWRKEQGAKRIEHSAKSKAQGARRKAHRA